MRRRCSLKVLSEQLLPSVDHGISILMMVHSFVIFPLPYLSQKTTWTLYIFSHSMGLPVLIVHFNLVASSFLKMSLPANKSFSSESICPFSSLMRSQHPAETLPSLTSMPVTFSLTSKKLSPRGISV